MLMPKTQNRQETGNGYYWNTMFANVCDMLKLKAQNRQLLFSNIVNANI